MSTVRSSSLEAATVAPAGNVQPDGTAFHVLAAVSFAHLLNDTIQSVLPAIYPVLKAAFGLSFGQIGLMTLSLMLTASLLQPLVGLYTDRRPTPYALAVGMTFSLAGLLLLSVAWTFGLLLTAAGLVGLGSSVFHPESSRVARMASGGRHGLAQSLFQVGGNVGSSLGPLVAAFLIAPFGQRSIAWCSLLAITGIAVVSKVGRWSRSRMSQPSHAGGEPGRRREPRVVEARRRIDRHPGGADLLEVLLHGQPQQLLHVLPDVEVPRLGANGAAGPVHFPRSGGRRHDPGRADRRPDRAQAGDLGVDPRRPALQPPAPARELFWTPILTVIIGLILASAFSAIVVYAQELVPGRVGLISGVFFGFAFGMGGLGAAVLGELADGIGIEAVYRLCAFLPAIGLLTAFLPDVERPRRVARPI